MGYRAVILGVGSIAASYFKAIPEVENISLIAISDILPERLNEAAQQYGVKPYLDYREMIMYEKPDIGIIALPPFLHKEAAVFCAEQGCHILLEKPMAMNTAQCDEINRAVREHHVKLLVGHTMHFISAVMKVKEIVESGELGELVMVNDRRYVDYFKDRLGWFIDKEKSGGGILMNLGSHSIDKLMWITGSRVRSVRAMFDHQASQGDIEGAGHVFLELENGVTATVFHSGYGGVALNETEFIFTKGMVKLLASKLKLCRNDEWIDVPIVPRNSYIRQLEALATAIEQDIDPECSGEYAKAIIQVLEAVYRSAELQKQLSVKY